VKKKEKLKTNKTFCELVGCPDHRDGWVFKNGMCVLDIREPTNGEKYACYYLTKRGTLRKRTPFTYKKLIYKEYKRDEIVVISAYLKWRNEQKNKRKTI
jgi:hypothetical protein